MAKRNPTEYMRTMGVKLLEGAKAAPKPAPAKAREVFNSFTQHFGLQQAVHEFASCPCEACAWLRSGKSAEQLEQMQRAALQAAPIVKPNKEQL